MAAKLSKFNFSTGKSNFSVGSYLYPCQPEEEPNSHWEDPGSGLTPTTSWVLHKCFCGLGLPTSKYRASNTLLRKRIWIWLVENAA